MRSHLLAIVALVVSPIFAGSFNFYNFNKPLTNYSYSNPELLKSIEYHVTVQGFVAQVQVKQRLENHHRTPVEGTVKLPKPPGIVITQFEVFTDGKHFVSELKDEYDAGREFAGNKEAGNTVFMVSQRGDNVHIDLGNIAPGQVVDTVLHYLTPLDMDDFKVYISIAQGGQFNVPGKLLFSIDEAEGSAVRYAEFNGAKVSGMAEYPFEFALAKGNNTLVLYLAEEQQTSLLVETNKYGEKTLVANVLQKLPDVEFEQEIVFIVDRSGSMSYKKIDRVKDALRLMLKKLPTNSYFDIISFGSTFDAMFGKLEKTNETTVQKALGLVSGFDADYGSTDIVSPLLHAMKLPRRSGVTRQIVLLTDGEDNMNANVIDTISENVGNTIVHTIAIGNAADFAMCKQISELGNGASEQVGNDMLEQVGDVVTRIVDLLKKPTMTEMRVTVSGFVFSEQVPATLPVAFPRSGMTLYWKLPEKFEIGSVEENATIVISGNVGREEVQVIMRVKDARSVAGEKMSQMMHYRIVQDLSARGWKGHRERIVAESLRYSILSDHVRFLVVEEREEKVKGQARKVETNVIGKENVNMEQDDWNVDNINIVAASVSTNTHHRTRSAGARNDMWVVYLLAMLAIVWCLW